MTERRFWLPIAAIWAIASVVLLMTTWSAIRTWRFPDPDDQMRLLQVRDWLAGQSWFDVAQYRLNIPIGVPMHWSRIVDLPIAAIIVVARPLVGGIAAEHIALVLVPLLTLGVVMVLLATITRRLLPDEMAPLAVCMAPLCIEVIHQLRPMRIDHHGWQMALALVAALALIDSNRKRAGWIAGAAVAVWLSISLEGLPMVAGVLAFVALRWVAEPAEGMLLRRTAVSATGTALLIFMATQPTVAWQTSVCDAISPVYLAILGISATGLVAVTSLPLRTPIARLVALAVVGLAALTPIPLIAPGCATGPFAQLDPLVHDFWYLSVAEGLPIWTQTPSQIVNSIALPVIGLVAAAHAVKRTQGADRLRWISLLFLIGVSGLAAILVQRSSGVANLLAIPAVVSVIHPFLQRARTIASVPMRTAATFGVLMVAAPGLAVSTVIDRIVPDNQQIAIRKAMACLSANDMAVLRTLPEGNFLAPLDISPTILLLTEHSAVASGHHRGSAAMRDVIAAFAGSDDVAHEIVLRRRITYVAFCPGLAETMMSEALSPRGLLARLDNGEAPVWLAPIKIAGSPVKVWRVH